MQLKPQLTENGIIRFMEYGDKEKYSLISPDFSIETKWVTRGKRLGIWALWGLYCKQLRNYAQ